MFYPGQKNSKKNSFFLYISNMLLGFFNIQDKNTDCWKLESFQRPQMARGWCVLLRSHLVQSRFGLSYTGCMQNLYLPEGSYKYIWSPCSKASFSNMSNCPPGDTRLVSNLVMITQTLILPKRSWQVHIPLLPFEVFSNMPISSNCHIWLVWKS